jgi:DNA repair protein RecN (Recombination protein N)
MLKELHISNIAIIDKLQVEFREGLNVLTGETGAGKSIIIDALNLALGGRADTDMIRSGQTTASVEALFYSKDPELFRLLEDLGIETEDNQIIIKRIISTKDKNRNFINGSNITVGVLSQIGQNLVDIHGQHDHQTLLQPMRHLEMLDAYGKLTNEKTKLSVAYKDYLSVCKQIQKLESNERERLQREDLLKFQLEEIDRAELSEGEEEKLKAELKRLSNFETIRQSLSRASGCLADEEGSIIEKLRIVEKELGALEALDSETESFCKQAQNIFYEAEDLAEKLSSYAYSIEFNPERLSEVEDRFAQINELKRKYGNDVGIILAYREEINEELETLSSSQEEAELLKSKCSELEKSLSKISIKLAEKREAIAAELKKKLEKELRDLNMKKACIEALFKYEDNGFVEFRNKKTKLNSWGLGNMEFAFSSNPGETPKPLSKIASGGELSRVALALKTILNKQDPVPVLVFDEVDTGVGGATAEKIGAKLLNLAKTKQALCITHLPQIAGMGNAHFSISKEAADRTRVQIQELDYDQRVEEIARMSGGEKVSETARNYAREMIKSK